MAEKKEYQSSTGHKDGFAGAEKIVDALKDLKSNYDKEKKDADARTGSVSESGMLGKAAASVQDIGELIKIALGPSLTAGLQLIGQQIGEAVKYGFAEIQKEVSSQLKAKLEKPEEVVKEWAKDAALAGTPMTQQEMQKAHDRLSDFFGVQQAAESATDQFYAGEGSIFTGIKPYRWGAKKLQGIKYDLSEDFTDWETTGLQENGDGIAKKNRQKIIDNYRRSGE